MKHIKLGTMFGFYSLELRNVPDEQAEEVGRLAREVLNINKSAFDYDSDVICQIKNRARINKNSMKHTQHNDPFEHNQYQDESFWDFFLKNDWKTIVGVAVMIVAAGIIYINR